MPIYVGLEIKHFLQFKEQKRHVVKHFINVWTKMMKIYVTKLSKSLIGRYCMHILERKKLTCSQISIVECSKVLMYRIFQDELSSEKTINALIVVRNVNNYDHRCDPISNRSRRKEV